MNKRAMGAKREYKTMRFMEEKGYVCTRAAGSGGVWDVIAIGPVDVVLIQVKSNRNAEAAERLLMEQFECPASVRKEIHIWHDRQKDPEIRVIGSAALTKAAVAKAAGVSV